LRKYKINYTKAVQKDITDIAYYISDCLKNLSAAEDFLDFIEVEIDKLELFPFKYHEIGCRYREQEIRMKSAGDYNIFYVINVQNMDVTILRVLNRRKEWEWLLEKM